jgi:hypothetical protein
MSFEAVRMSTPLKDVCRVVDAFVARLDVAGLGFERAEAAETGRPGYDHARSAKRPRMEDCSLGFEVNRLQVGCYF